MKYPYVIERTPTGYGAYVPDLPGYGYTAETPDQVRALVREGVPFHLEALREFGEPIPEPWSSEDAPREGFELIEVS
ncbi:MAG: type II toxin-antitoxin system HicB family antitoxin [Candidatus Eremiobacteraeota bacterium]|nr:type II toxin-antitoxin system HicB family antitoxin [Candidatus Eremiobacteraeota bacterium]